MTTDAILTAAAVLLALLELGMIAVATQRIAHNLDQANQNAILWRADDIARREREHLTAEHLTADDLLPVPPPADVT